MKLLDVWLITDYYYSILYFDPKYSFLNVVSTLADIESYLYEAVEKRGDVKPSEKRIA